jgi:hypothetical protein
MRDEQTRWETESIMNLKYLLIYCCWYTFILCSCEASFSKKDQIERTAWKADVNKPATDSAIKEYWFDLIGKNWDFFKQQNSSLQPNDFNNLSFLHCLVYEIDSSHLFNFNKSTSIKSLLSLNRSEIISYAIKNDSIVAIVYPELVNGKWQNGVGYSVPSKAQAQRISQIYKSGGEVYCITLNPFPRTPLPYRKYIVAYRNKNLMIIGQDGIFSRFDNELLIIKEHLIQLVEENEKVHWSNLD